MNGIHEVTGSIPVRSTTLTSLRSFGWRPFPGLGLIQRTLRVR
jgi:hypothetical protein